MLEAVYGLIGASIALVGVWLGFYLARLAPDASPSAPKMPESFEGEILDFAVYGDQVADE